MIDSVSNSADLKRAKRTRQYAQQGVDRLLPHSLEAELGVLGCIMISPNECLDDAQTQLKAGGKAFYDLRHRSIWEALVEMQKDSKAIDVITLQQHLKDKNILEQVGGLAYLSTLPDTVPSAANLSYYLEIVKEKYILRKFINTCQYSVNQVYEHEGDIYDFLSKAQTAFNKLLDDDSESTLDAKAAGKAMVDDLEYRFNLNGKRSGLSTGFTKLDNITDGLQFGEQFIIGARPSTGKTAILMNMVKRICLEDKIPTTIATYEMRPAALMKRLLSDWAEIPMSEIRTGQFTNDHFAKFSAFNALVADSPLHIIHCNGKMHVDMLCAQIRMLWRKHGVRFCGIDYLQKIPPSPAKREEKKTYEIGSVSGTLYSLWQETKIAGLLLAQLNREPDKEKSKGGNSSEPRRPRLSDLADSKSIEADGDGIALLHRPNRSGPDAYKTELIIGKQRDGELGIVPLNFNGDYCRFTNPPIEIDDAETQQQ